MDKLNSYIAQAQQTLAQIDEHISPMYQSPYDTAWVSRVRDKNGKLRWPHLSKWLIKTQHADGSWGGEIYYPHDRVITTLSACIALKKNEKDLPYTAYLALNKGKTFLQEHVFRLSHVFHELVGFELIYPMLCHEATQLGIEIPTYANGYTELKRNKLSRVPQEMLYSPNSTTAHSLEFLGDSVNSELIAGVAGASGVANSPSATAYFLGHVGSHKGADSYLEELVTREVIPYAYPCRLFESIWALNALTYSGLSITEFLPPDSPFWSELRHMIEKHGGVGFDESFGIIDGDDTSIAVKLLQLAGTKISPDVLTQFQTEEMIFRTYNYERDPSIGTNIHALEAISLIDNYPNQEEVYESVLDLVMQEKQKRGAWTDKWHISPLYIVSHMIPALKHNITFRPTLNQIVQEVWSNQNPDGSWGYLEKSTLEETAYGLIILGHYYQIDPSEDLKLALQSGRAYLESSYRIEKKRYPELWIGKVLYTPHRIVDITILSALILCEKIL